MSTIIVAIIIIIIIIIIIAMFGKPCIAEVLEHNRNA